MSQKLNHSRDYHNFLDTAVENELKTNEHSTSESLWVKMGSQLEIEGIPAEQISTIMRKDIEDRLFESEFKEYMDRDAYKWHSGHYFRVMKKHAWINPTMSRNIKITPSGEQDYSSIYAKYNEKNGMMLLVCDNIIDICRTIKEKSTSEECKNLEDIFGKKQMYEFYFQQDSITLNIQNAIDNKTKIPPNTELFLLECLATVMGNTNKCGKIFQQIIMAHMEEQNKFLTQKQATKFQTGARQSQLFLLKPTSRDFAIYEGYTGVQCTCSSWRVRPKLDHTTDWECYDCDKIIPKQHIPKCSCCQIPLYKDRIQHIVKTGKCENCNEKIELPQILIDQIYN